jgi:hypothetical protein
MVKWGTGVSRLVRPLVVVVLDKLSEHPVEVVFAPYEHPIQALGPCRAHKPLREGARPRRPNGGLDDLGAGRAQDLVERPDELAITVADQEVDGPALVLQGGDQGPGLLGDPWSDRVGRARKTLRRRRSMKNST